LIGFNNFDAETDLETFERATRLHLKTIVAWGNKSLWAITMTWTAHTDTIERWLPGHGAFSPRRFGRWSYHWNRRPGIGWQWYESILQQPASWRCRGGANRDEP